MAARTGEQGPGELRRRFRSRFPFPGPYRTSRRGEAFRYLVLFTALGITAFSVVGLFFTLIDYLFYDPAAVPLGSDVWVPDVLWAVARVIIAFPVFVAASWLVARSLRQDPAERGSAIRRWFTYLAMFVAVAVIIGDFVTLVAYVLGGGTTARFLLKVLVVAVVAGLILGYYLWDIRDSERGRRPVPALFLGVAVLTSVAAVGAGLWLMGPPSEQAARRIDDRRVEDLRSLAAGVDRFYEQNAELPESLGELSAALPTPIPLDDPSTRAPYRYSPGTDRTFELCADFAQPSGEGLARDSIWTHAAGTQCFTLTAGGKDRR
ncbi:MAG: DUF5671 domain-containing protein [Mycobacterium sp.]